jgi:hypothetical protein
MNIQDATVIVSLVIVLAQGIAGIISANGRAHLEARLVRLETIVSLVGGKMGLRVPTDNQE